MPSAVARLPSRITLLMNCWTVTFANFRSPTWTRSVGRARRGITCSSLALLWRPLLRLRVLRAVEAAPLLAILDPGRVEGPADDVVLHRREIWDPASAHEHDGVLLEVVADAG